MKNVSMEERVYIQHKLNTDEIKTLDDCKKVLKFLCGLLMKPLPSGVEYNGFSDVEQYFE